MIIWLPSYLKSGNTWEKILNPETQKEIENSFQNEMMELGCLKFIKLVYSLN